MICTDQDITTAMGACGLVIPTALASQVPRIHARVERLVKDYVGYDVEYNANCIDYDPVGLGNTRFDGDETSAGFDMAGGVVVQRAVARLGRRQLVLTRLPVRSVQAVYDNPAAYNTSPPTWPASSLLPPQAYYLDQPDETGLSWSGILWRSVGYWSYTPNVIRIQYTAGLQTTDSQYSIFKDAVIDSCMNCLGALVARARMAITGFIPSSVSIEDFSAGLAPASAGMLGGPGSPGVGEIALPSTVRQYLAQYVHPARYF